MSAQAPGTNYKTEVAQWRAQQESDLLQDEGWLSVAGLVWLDQGDNSLGSAKTCKVVLPSPAPLNLGNLNRNGDEVTLDVTAGGNVTIDGKTVTSADMDSDDSGKPVKAHVGPITFTIIKRGKRIGVRIYDNNSSGRQHFTGMHWYPTDTHYLVKAKYTAYDPPRQIPITNVLGDTSMNPNPGYVEFTLDGKPCRLEAQTEDSGLFFNFQDGTTGRTTYAAGRFLDAPKPVGGYVMLDFNEATNPPCAFTRFATCPLPPKGNKLKVAIKAGEKMYKAAGTM